MLLQQLQALGVPAGGVLLIHTALSRVGSSPQALIEALLAAVGPAGTRW
jgi:aminoglycoside N3'-acetyltransferase